MAAAEDYRTRISQVSYCNQAFINGKFVAAQSGKTFDCISPIDGQVLTKVASCDRQDVDHAVKAARTVFEKGTWSQMAPMQLDTSSPIRESALPLSDRQTEMTPGEAASRTATAWASAERETTPASGTAGYTVYRNRIPSAADRSGRWPAQS